MRILYIGGGQKQEVQRGGRQGEKVLSSPDSEVSQQRKRT